MLAVFSFSVNAICPLLLMVLLGYQLKKFRFLTEEFLKVGNRFVFKIAIPVQLFLSIYKIESLSMVDPIFQLALLAALLAIICLGCLLARFCTTRRDRKAVLIQAALRSNYAAAGLAIAGSLAGAEGEALGALAAPMVVIVYNVVAVIALTVYSGKERHHTSVGTILLNTAKNPLILGIVAGLAALVIRGFIPLGADGLPVFTLKTSLPWLYEFLSDLGSIGLPLALIIMGGNFRLDVIGGMRKELISGVLARNLISPLLGFTVAGATAAALGAPLVPAAWAVLIGVFCTPLAVATTVMSAEMGSDHHLASQILVWSSIGSLVSSVAAIAILRTVGLL